jgi:hypothetical protein
LGLDGRDTRLQKMKLIPLSGEDRQSPASPVSSTPAQISVRRFRGSTRSRGRKTRAPALSSSTAPANGHLRRRGDLPEAVVEPLHPWFRARVAPRWLRDRELMTMGTRRSAVRSIAGPHCPLLEGPQGSIGSFT